MAGGPRTGGRILVDQLRLQGVDTVFGVPGESYLEVLDALHDTPEIRFVICRQEGGAAMMATAWGELTGRPGVAMVTRGPGATNASAGVHVAQQDSVPMILFVGPDRPRQPRARHVPGGRLSPACSAAWRNGWPRSRMPPESPNSSTAPSPPRWPAGPGRSSWRCPRTCWSRPRRCRTGARPWLWSPRRLPRPWASCVDCSPVPSGRS